MRPFFIYNYETHNTDHMVLKLIYKHVLWFHEFVEVIENRKKYSDGLSLSAIEKSEIRSRIYACKNLFTLLGHKHVKALMPNFPYKTISRLGEILISRRNTIELTQQEYEGITREMAQAMPLAHQLLQKHQQAVVAIKLNNVNNIHYSSALAYDEANIRRLELKIKGLSAPGQSQSDESTDEEDLEIINSFEEKVEFQNDFSLNEDNADDSFISIISDDLFDGPAKTPKVKTAAELAQIQQQIVQMRLELEQLKKNQDEKYNYPEMASPVSTTKTPTPQEDELKFPCIEGVLAKHSDPQLIKQIKHMIDFMDRIVMAGKIEINDILILYKIFTFINELTHSNHLYQENFYDNASIKELHDKINCLRNEIIHSLDDHQDVQRLIMAITTPGKMHDIAALIKMYTTILVEVPQNSHSTLTAYARYVHVEHQKAKTQLMCNFMLPAFVRPIKNFTQQAPLANFMYQIDSIKVFINHFKKYCNEQNLTVGKIERLFYCEEAPRSYDALNDTELKNRLVIEGIMQALGEVTGMMRKGKTENTSLLNVLPINADDYAAVENFIITLTSYRNMSMHEMRHDDISIAAETLLNAQGIDVLLEKLDELTDVAKKHYPVSATEEKKKITCPIM